MGQIGRPGLSDDKKVELWTLFKARDLLEDRQISQVDLAARMGRRQKTISEIVNGKAAITPETAIQLALVTGVAAKFWNARERNDRSFVAQQGETERLWEAEGLVPAIPREGDGEAGMASPN